jgi:ATP-binding cassette subfamily B protein
MADKNINYENMPKFGRGGAGRRRFAPVEKPKDTKGTMLRLMKIFTKWSKPLLVAAVLTILSALLSLLTPWLLGRAINAFQIQTGVVNTALLKTILIALIACYLSSWVIDTVNGTLMAHITQRLVKHIRTELFSKLQRTPLNFYDTRPHGDIMSRITNDVDNISSTIAQTTTQLISSVFTITGAVVMMLILNPVMTLVAMVSIPFFALLTKTVAKRSRVYFLGQQRMLGALNGVVEENIEGLKMVKAFNLQEKVLSDFKSVNEEMCRKSQVSDRTDVVAQI